MLKVRRSFVDCWKETTRLWTNCSDMLKAKLKKGFFSGIKQHSNVPWIYDSLKTDDFFSALLNLKVPLEMNKLWLQTLILHKNKMKNKEKDERDLTEEKRLRWLFISSIDFFFWKDETKLKRADSIGISSKIDWKLFKKLFYLSSLGDVL